MFPSRYGPANPVTRFALYLKKKEKKKKRGAGVEQGSYVNKTDVGCSPEIASV